MAYEEFNGELDGATPKFMPFDGKLDEAPKPSLLDRARALFSSSDIPASDPMGTGSAEIMAQPTADTRPVLDRPMPGYQDGGQFKDAVSAGDVAALNNMSRSPYATEASTKAAATAKAKSAATTKAAGGTRDALTFGKDALVALGRGGNSVMQLPLAVFAPGGDAYKWVSENGKQLEALESPEMKARRQIMAERIAESPDEMGKFFAGLGEMVGNPSIAFSVMAEQLPIMGAILATGGIGAAGGRAAVGAASRFSPAIALADAIGGGSVAAAGATRGALIGTGAASAIGAGGDAAQGTFDQIMSLRATPTSLLELNPDYQAMVARGMSPYDARRQIATSKSRLSAMLAAPLGILSGVTGVEAVASGAVKRGGIATGIKTGLKEMGGELPEELGTQAASNFAIGQVDPRQSLTEGLGETAAQALIGTAPTSIAGGVHAGSGPRLMNESTPDQADQLPSLFQRDAPQAAKPPAQAVRVEDQPTTPMTPEEILSVPVPKVEQAKPDRVDVNDADAVLAQLGLGQPAEAAPQVPVSPSVEPVFQTQTAAAIAARREGGEAVAVPGGFAVQPITQQPNAETLAIKSDSGSATPEPVVSAPATESVAPEDWRATASQLAVDKFDADVKQSIENSAPVVDEKLHRNDSAGWSRVVQRDVGGWGLVDNDMDRISRVTLIKGSTLANFYYRKGDAVDQARATAAAETWAFGRSANATKAKAARASAATAETAADFSASRSTPMEAARKPSQKSPDVAVQVDLRKRASVLQSLLECMA